ncbi:MAG: TetR/AcrR family transcriptional regulator, partial [Myxococcales bacterium]|nr:TetR/AcrR family transcriptional regulator [Myxococcales bacterium]
MRDRILAASRSIFLDEGLDALSMRRVAQEVGISAMTIYIYFENRQAIVLALLREGLALLEHRLVEATKSDDPMSRIDDLSKAYLDFAEEHPRYYGAFTCPVEMHAELDVDSATALAREYCDALSPLRKTLVSMFPETGVADNRLVAIVSAIHGFASLRGHISS